MPLEIVNTSLWLIKSTWSSLKTIQTDAHLKRKKKRIENRRDVKRYWKLNERVKINYSNSVVLGGGGKQWKWREKKTGNSLESSKMYVENYSQTI